MNDDGVTADNTPTVLIQADLSQYVEMEIPVLEPENPEDDNMTLPDESGIAVEVFITNADTGAVQTGFASSVAEGSAFVSFHAG